MPFPKVEDTEKILVNGRKPSILVKPVKPGRTDPDFESKVRKAVDRKTSESQ